MSPQTYITRSVGVRTEVRLSPSVSSTILRNCRRHRVSLGAALTVLAQVATARVLHRRYLRGEIPEHEWIRLRKQPTRSRGPFSMRPYLDETWRKNGGETEVMVAITYFWCSLPAFPSPQEFSASASTLSRNGVPSFGELLTHKRFLYRCDMIKKQLKSCGDLICVH